MALCLMLMIAACGSAGSNEEEEDDSQFPEPPGRPGAVQVDTATVSSATSAVPVYATTPAVFSDARRLY